MDSKYIYKGFETEVNFTKEDNVFYGKLINIKDLVTWESDTIEESEKAFQEAVDDYIAMREDLNKVIN